MKRRIPNERLFDEWRKCGLDPEYFLKTYVHVQHTLHGLVPFDTYPFQDRCLQDFKKHRFNIVLKARQLGLSTITAGYCLWMALFYKDKNVLVIATKLSTAMEFTRKIKIMLESLPENLILVPYTVTKQEIKFANGSSIVAVPTSEDAGRSTSLSLLVVDECAWIRDFENIWTGLAPTLSTGGSAILLSTPNGVGGQYYKLWTDAEAEQNNFHPIKLMWYEHPDHDQEWFDKQTRSLSKKKIAQEYECSFEGSGDTLVQAEDLEYLHSVILEPTRMTDLYEKKPYAAWPEEQPEIDRHLWLWDKPQADHRYVISGDASRGNSNDYAALHVVDLETFEVAAEWLGKLPADKFADFLMKVGRYYNEGLIAVENNTYGWFTNVRVRDSGYPRLLYQTSKGDIYNYKPEEEDEKPGFSTQKDSRQLVLVKLEQLIRNKRLKLHSQRTFDQLRTFVWHNNKPMAMRDAHDDLVISLAIGAWIVDNYVQVPEEEQNNDDTRALLAATSKSVRSSSDVIPGITTTNPAKYGKDAAEPFKPHDPSRLRGLPTIGYDWLLK